MTHVQVAKVRRLDLRSLQAIDCADHQSCIQKESNQAVESEKLRQTPDPHEVICSRNHLVHTNVEGKEDNCLRNHNDDTEEHALA